MRLTPRLVASLTLGTALWGCSEEAPLEYGKTPEGTGATVRFSLAHEPLPDIPMPNDTATWADPTSRTGLRLNASLIAPTAMEADARERFDRLEGWGIFSPISISFDLAEVDGAPRRQDEAALDLQNLIERHHHDDYDFFDDAIYLVNLTTGVPVALDLGSGNFDYTLRHLDRTWANDPKASERNLMFETRDETKFGSVDAAAFSPEMDLDFDGTLDVPNLKEPFQCPDPHPVCDAPGVVGYDDPLCVDARRERDQCIADHLLRFYERETDTLIVRPLIPLESKTRYAVVVTDRTKDRTGEPVRSPFSQVFHASQRAAAERVEAIINDTSKAGYFGGLAGTGLGHVAFVWSFTTQPTTEDLLTLRDGLYGQGPFGYFSDEFPPTLELARLVGPTAGLEEGGTDPAGWETSSACKPMADNLYVMRIEDLRPTLDLAIPELFGTGDGPSTQMLLRSLDSIDRIVVGSFRSPYLLEGGPDDTRPSSSFNLDYEAGTGSISEDRVSFFMFVPKETETRKQPFDVNVYGHGYTGGFVGHLFYAGLMADRGIATVGINAMGHGIDLGDTSTELLAELIFSGACGGPFFDELSRTRARDLDADGFADPGGDFWSSYLFHTRDGVRQSVLDQVQLVRLFRSFGTEEGKMLCRTDDTGWAAPASLACDTDGDGTNELPGDFDGDGVIDVGGPSAMYTTWGESLGGVLAGIHGAIDPYVTASVPGSGAGGLTDVGVRSYQGGVIEAVILRMWGPLLVSIPAPERPACTGESGDPNHCTTCSADQFSLRWIVTSVNDTAEVEIRCLDLEDIENTTLLVNNVENQELRCASVLGDGRLRIGIPSSAGDRVVLSFYDGAHQVEDYASCRPTFNTDSAPRTFVDSFGKGHVAQGGTSSGSDAVCSASSCHPFQGGFFAQGAALVAPVEGLGQVRQTPGMRRFLQLAQVALEPGDPVAFASAYGRQPLLDPWGVPMAPRAVLTLNTVGDMSVPVSAGIAFGRATGALPFMRPDQLARYPEYADFVTPTDLYDALGQVTPNQDLIDRHVLEGVAPLGRHPASGNCPSSANANLGGDYQTSGDETLACYPTECADDPSVCRQGYCDVAQDRCVPYPLGETVCQQALFDPDDLDEGAQLYFEQAAPVPHRLARRSAPATASNLDEIWAPRLTGVPGGDRGMSPDGPLLGLLTAYIVPEGVHTFVNGNPCEAFDSGTYFTNVVARFFESGGTDLYYLSHPDSHRCLATNTCEP